jgi:hypothetical protein
VPSRAQQAGPSPSGVQQPRASETITSLQRLRAAAAPYPEAHRAGLERIVQAGAQPISWVSLACELQRDWSRTDTVAVVNIILTSRLLKGI